MEYNLDKTTKGHVSNSFDYIRDDGSDPSQQEIQKYANKHGGPSIKVTGINQDGPGGGSTEVNVTGHPEHIMKLHNHHNDDDYSHDMSGYKKMTSDYGMKSENYVNEAAIDTLKPGGAPGETKAQTLDTFVQLLAQLGKEDLSDLFNQVQAQYGPGQAPGAVDNSQNNAATVAMKPSAAIGESAWKEDLDNLFTGDDLTEELKEKTQVVFEAAVNTRASLVEARLEEQFEEAVEALEEEYNEKLQEQANEIFESVTDKLDQYLDYVVEKWMNENELAVESGIRVQIAEDFMDSLHGVFTEHYITIPESKLDIVADLKEEVEDLREKLNSVLDEKIQLESVNKEFTKSQIIEDLSEDLAETQVDKLSTLAEGLEYTNPDNFKRKVSILKERYFGTSSKTTGLITEVIDGTVDEESATTGFTTPEMRAYAQAISKSVK